MAIYHLEAKVVSRGTGRSAVAASAYLSCSKILNDYDGVQHDYTHKKGLVWQEVFLPEFAPSEWKERGVLWNAVEENEKTKDSRLAREFVVALPIELNETQWEKLLSDFISGTFVADGMCADVAIHDPYPPGHNPHAHIMLTVRPLDEKGNWQYKTQKEYLCVKNGEEQGFTADEFKIAQTEGWEKQYQYKVGKKKVYMTASAAEAKGYERVSKYPKKEMRAYIENAHTPIIDREVWDKVQMIRENKRRPTNSGITSMFSGLLYCADCGAKLSLATANRYTHFRCSQYKRTSRTQNCTQHYIREDALNQLVLKQLQHFLSYLQQFERVFIRQQIDTTLAERRYELSAKQKQIEKDEKRMDELDRLFRKIYEDNVNGKLNDERFCKLSDGYEAEQEQLKQEIESLTAEVSEADMETTNVSKLIAVTKKYTRIDELTPEILNAFVDKIVIHEREKKDGKRTQQIDIYYSYVGIVDIPTDEEMREMEREYMQRTTRQTA